MSERIKHHYVPEVYLQRFAVGPRGDLFSLTLKPFYDTSKIKLVNKSGICYEKDFYRFKNKRLLPFGEGDMNSIENKGFTYENNEISRIFNLFDSPKFAFESQFIFRSDVQRFAEIIMSIKRRNPSLAKQWSLKRVNELAWPILDSLKSKLGKELAGRVIDEYVKVGTNDDFAEDLYRSSIYKRDVSGEQDKKMMAKFLTSKIMVFRTSLDCPFITSDNPGFNFDDNSQLQNTNFDFVSHSYFVVSPKTMIFFDFRKKDISDTIYKKVGFVDSSLEMVNMLNLATSVNANEKIFSNFKDQLAIVKADYKINVVDKLSREG